MRSATYGLVPDLAQKFSTTETLTMFQKMCLIRYFELHVARAAQAGLFKMPIYLSVGQESIAAALATVMDKPNIFGQHRCHDLYLAFGGNPAQLRDELLHRPTGCAKGMGGSASIHSPEIGMFGHDGLMGSQIPIAVGHALGTGKPTLAVMGDASAEEDYAIAALGYASHKKLPILFVVMDNGLSILTKVAARRNWSMVDVAHGFKMRAKELTDDPWLIMDSVRRIPELPALLNIHTVRHLRHNGFKSDGAPEWDRFALVKEELQKLGLGRAAEYIETATQEAMEALWAYEIPEEVK